MPDNELLKSFFEGTPPRNIRLVAARGAVPIPSEQMLMLLVRLARDPDPEVAETATQTLDSWPEKEIVLQLQSPACSAEVLTHFSCSAAPAVQEAIIMNPAASGAAIATLASCVPASLLDAILYNRTRLLDSPGILENIKLNPAATPQILALVQEIETEFFGEKKQSYTVEEAEEEVPLQEVPPALETELPPDDLSLEGLPLDPQQREAAILSRIGAMTVRQKIQLALMGSREARAVLVRDTNKEVSRAVLQSPKLAKNEIEAIASMRNISDDILRQIGTSKRWTKNYSIVQNLVKNPKTPPTISQRLLSRLQSRDLMLLARDRGLPEAVRRNAETMLKQRNAAR